MKKYIILISTAVGLIVGGKTYAQDSDSLEFEEYNNLYIQVEFGRNNDKINMLQGGITLEMGKNYYKIKVTSAVEPKYKTKQYLGKVHPEISDISLIMGRSFKLMKYQRFHFGTGLSAVTHVVRGNSQNPDSPPQEENYKQRYTVGLPVELRYSFNFNRNIAISCTGHVNANPIKSFTGLSAGIMLGLF